MKPIAFNRNDAMFIELINDETKEIYSGIYIDMRVDFSTIPEGLFAYNCRHGDDGDWVTPVTVEKGKVLVNHSGVFMTENEIKFPDNKNYICVTCRFL